MIIELPQLGGDLARRVRAVAPEAVIRKDRDLGRGGPLMRVKGASPEQIRALRAKLHDLKPDSIAET
jgi:hypothetical protein